MKCSVCGRRQTEDGLECDRCAAQYVPPQFFGRDHAKRCREILASRLTAGDHEARLALALLDLDSARYHELLAERANPDAPAPLYVVRGDTP